MDSNVGGCMYIDQSHIECKLIFKLIESVVWRCQGQCPKGVPTSSSRESRHVKIFETLLIRSNKFTHISQLTLKLHLRVVR